MFMRNCFLGLLPIFVVPASLEGDERGAAWKRHTIDVSARGADGARLMDVNGDKLPDVATGFEEGGVVRIALHPGHAKVHQPWPSVQVGRVGSPEDAVFVDLDNDGAVDVVSCCEGRTRSVFVHWAPRDSKRYLDSKAWKSEAFPSVKGTTQWMFATPMQIDGKHGIDLVVGSKNANGQVGWLQSPANPRDLSGWKYHKLYDAGWIMSLVAADVDRDNDVDVLVSDRRGKTRGCLWIENPGAKNALRVWKTHRIGPTGDEVMLLDWADVDRDGLKDVIVPTSDNKLLYFRRTTLKPVEWKLVKLPFPTRTGTGKAVRVGDIDLDGKLDLVIACERANKGSGIVWMSYRKSPLLGDWDVHEVSGSEGIKFDLNQLVDLDADGDLDIVNTEERSNRGGLGVVWYENPSR